MRHKTLKDLWFALVQWVTGKKDQESASRGIEDARPWAYDTFIKEVIGELYRFPDTARSVGPSSV